MSQSVKNLPAVEETWIQSLSHEGLLEREMATSPVFLLRESQGQIVKELEVFWSFSLFSNGSFSCFYIIFKCYFFMNYDHYKFIPWCSLLIHILVCTRHFFLPVNNFNPCIHFGYTETCSLWTIFRFSRCDPFYVVTKIKLQFWFPRSHSD